MKLLHRLSKSGFLSCLSDILLVVILEVLVPIQLPLWCGRVILSFLPGNEALAPKWMQAIRALLRGEKELAMKLFAQCIKPDSSGYGAKILVDNFFTALDRRRWTYRNLAWRIGVDEKTILRIIREEVKMPRASTIEAICHELKLSPAQLGLEEVYEYRVRNKRKRQR